MLADIIKLLFNGTFKQEKKSDNVSKGDNYTFLNLINIVPEDEKDVLNLKIKKMILTDDSKEHVSKVVINNSDLETKNVIIQIENILCSNINYPQKYNQFFADGAFDKQFKTDTSVINFLTTVFLGSKPLVEKLELSNIVCKTQKYQFRADTLDFETQQDNRLELWLKGLELENSEQFNLQLPGELSADLHLAATVTQDALVLDGNFSIGQHCAVSFQVTPLFEQAAIKDLMLRLRDNGALAWVALNLGAPDELATLINQMLSQLKDKVSDDIKGMIFIDAVRAFLQKPGSIELKSIYGLPIKLDELKARLAKPADNFVVTSTQGSVPLEEQVQMLAS